MLLLLEESVLLWSPIIFSIVKPDPLEDRRVDLVIGVVEDVTRLDDKSSCLDEVKHGGNGDERELRIF